MARNASGAGEGRGCPVNGLSIEAGKGGAGGSGIGVFESILGGRRGRGEDWNGEGNGTNARRKDDDARPLHFLHLLLTRLCPPI